jgi:hypothetical protein
MGCSNVLLPELFLLKWRCRHKTFQLAFVIASARLVIRASGVIW